MRVLLAFMGIVYTIRTMTAIGDKKKIPCGRPGCRQEIPLKRRRNARVRGKTVKYCSDTCMRRVARDAYNARQAG